jgi:N-acetylneuraminate synthase
MVEKRIIEVHGAAARHHENVIHALAGDEVGDIVGQYGELNLRVIPTLRERYGVPVGYSGHETGIPTSAATIALGACMVERHVTLDRAMWGSDQAASLEPNGITRLVRDIRLIETALGDGIKRVEEREVPVMEKLRRVDQRLAG